MKTINFFGGPGAGKSTAASGLFYEMKKHWIMAEYVPEYAKELVWSNSSHMLSEQNYIFAEQEHRLNRLRQKVDVAISDSPLLLSAFYAPDGYPASFHQSVFDFFHSYDNINIFVKRSHEYSLEGRIQDEADADYLANEMEEYLKKNGIEFWSITASNAAPKRLLGWLVEKMGVPMPHELVPDTEPAPANWLVHHQPSIPWKSGRDIWRPRLSGIVTVG